MSSGQQEGIVLNDALKNRPPKDEPPMKVQIKDAVNKKVDAAADMAEEAKQKGTETIEQVKEKGSEMMETVKEKAAELKDKSAEVMQKGVDKADQGMHDARQAAIDAGRKAEEAIETFVEAASDAIKVTMNQFDEAEPTEEMQEQLKEKDPKEETVMEKTVTFAKNAKDEVIEKSEKAVEALKEALTPEEKPEPGMIDSAKETISHMAQNVTDTASHAVEYIADTTHAISQKTMDVAHAGVEKVQEAATVAKAWVVGEPQPDDKDQNLPMVKSEEDKKEPITSEKKDQ